MERTQRSRRRVDAELDRLEADYGDFDVVDARWEWSTEEYAWVVDRFERGTLGGAGVWLTNDDGAVLLVRDEGREGWTDPGGKHEPGETLEETARREVAEETGVDCAITGVGLTQVVEIVAAEEPSVYRLIVIFEGEFVGGTPRPAEGEIDEVRWWTEHPPVVGYDELRRLEIPAASDG